MAGPLLIAAACLAWALDNNLTRRVSGGDAVTIAALKGLVAGTVAALVASPDVLDENGDCTTIECISYQVSPNLDTRIVVLSSVGALLGTIAGALTKVDTWVAVPFKRVDIGPTPDGGLALGVRISF